MVDATQYTIAAISGVLGIVVGIWTSARSHNLAVKRLSIEKEKINAEINKLSAETERLSIENANITNRNYALNEIIINNKKIKADHVSSKINNLYPHILELIYRLRNSLRDINLSTKAVIDNYGSSSYKECLHVMTKNIYSFRGKYISGDIVDESLTILWKLTEELYVFKAYLDDNTWSLLHNFKRISQDISIHIDVYSRSWPSHHNVIDSIWSVYSDSYLNDVYNINDIKAINEFISLRYDEIDNSYNRIDKIIREYFETNELLAASGEE